MNLNMGGRRLPFNGRPGEVTPGAVVLAVILLAVAAAVAVVVIRTRMNGARRLELTVRARVATKRETKDGMYCVVWFDLPEGEKRELRLTASEASLLAEGQEGRLTCRGRRFIQFTRGDMAL